MAQVRRQQLPPLSSSSVASRSASQTSPAASASQTNSQASSQASSASSLGSSQASSTGTITSSGNALPSLGSSASSYDGIPTAPAISTTLPYPTPSVPPTAGAPFMQKSSAPDGTIFIAVGAAIGFFFFVVIAWRSAIAWSVHRRIKKFGGSYMGLGVVRDGKRLFSNPTAPFYKQSHGSDISLEPLATSGKPYADSVPNRSSIRIVSNPERSTNPTTLAGPTAASSLFFSPTAAGQTSNPAQRQASPYLPSGYYAAPGQVADPASARQASAQTRPFSMAEFASPTARAVSAGYPSHTRTRSQDDGGYLGVKGPRPGNAFAGSELSMLGMRGSDLESVASGDRTPSAALDEMFDMPPESPGLGSSNASTVNSSKRGPGRL